MRLPALWVGLLYDQTALDAAWDLVKDWTVEDHDFLRAETPQDRARRPIFRGRPPDGVGARGGRDRPCRAARAQAARRPGQRRDDLSGAARSRGGERASRPADELLAKWQGEWKGSFAPLFRDYAY